jgi:predicted secreted hydrolase
VTSRRSRRCCIAASLALACLAAAQEPSARAGTDDWERIRAPLALSWPRDHGAHPRFQTEWWYATGEVSSGDGRAYGYELTIFRQGLDASSPRPDESALRPRQIYAAHLAIVDVQAAKLRLAQRVRRGNAGLAGASEDDLHVWLEDWRMDRASDDTLALHAFDRERAIALDLELAPEVPLVQHGEGGISRKGEGEGNASAYVSWVRLRTRGTIHSGRLDDGGVHVTGESWFDHEWSTSALGSGVAGWDWFGLRLADGRALMLYRLRTADGAAASASAGTLVERDGSHRSLRAEDFRVEPVRRWSSPATHASYPVAWKVAVPSAGIECDVAARADDCEIDARTSVGTIYWEGPVAASGSVAGSGYLELTGYAASLAGRF